MQEIKVFLAKGGYFAQLGPGEFIHLALTQDQTHSLLCAWGAKKTRGQLLDPVAGTYVVRKERIPA